MESNFFRINLPYGMKRNSNGEWMLFNREYLPLGWNSSGRRDSIYDNNFFSDLSIYTRYNRLTENMLIKLSHDPEAVKKDDDGNIYMIFFYSDRTNPQNTPGYWKIYFEKIRLLSKCDVKPQAAS